MNREEFDLKNLIEGSYTESKYFGGGQPLERGHFQSSIYTYIIYS